MGVLGMGLTTAAVGEDFDGFYAAHFRDTVAMAYTLTADLGEAQDIAQEAFCRAWRRWPQIRGYENPVAWVRRVAVNLARSRWRRMKVASSRLGGLHGEDVRELNPDHVAVVAALRKLPARQREALVLHHMMDLPVSEVAEHFEVPVGTVKSWLHRGRAAIADDLRIDVSAAVAVPPAATVKRRRGSRARVAVATALALVVAAAGTLLALHFGPDRTAPLPPAQSPSPTPSPSPSPQVDPNDAMFQVDWMNTTLIFPALGGCPSGEMRITGLGSTGTIVSSDGTAIGLVTLERVAVGDLNADGRAEAVIPMRCAPKTQVIQSANELGVFERHGDGTIHLSTITQFSVETIQALWIRLGVVYVHTTWYPPRADHIGELRAYGIVAGVLTLIGTEPYPAMTDVNLTPVATRLACGLAPPEPDLRLHFDSDWLARAGQREFTILRPTEKPLFVDRGRTGLPYLVLTIGCHAASVSEWHSTTVLLERVGAEWLAVDVA